MAGNPLSYKDLFDFSDNGGIKGALRDVKTLKDSYKEFIEVVGNGQLAAIAQQQSQLADSARQLATATRELNVTTKDGQKSLIENAKLMAQLESANKKLAATQKATNTITDSAASSINALDAKLKEQIALYKQMSSASEQDRAAMDRAAASINRTRAEITQMTAAIRQNVTGFNAAKGSYAALDAETRQLVMQLKNLEGGLTKNNAAATALQKKIYDNTARLKEFDAAMNQNFRNVGNYRSALVGLGDQFKSYITMYVSLYAGIALVGKIIQSNKEISDSVADLRRTAQLTAQQAEALVNSLKKLDTRTSLKGLLDIAIIGGRLGIAKENLVGFTNAADKLTQTLGAELGTTEEITTGLGKIINIFSSDKTITGDALLHVGNAIIDLANKGVASGKYIVDFTQRLAGIAGVAKLSLGSTIGLGAGLEELGTSAEVGGTAVTQILFKIGSDVPKYARLAGRSVEDFGNTLKKAPVEALIQLAEGLAKNKAGFAEIAESFKEAEAKGVRVAGTLAVIGTNGQFLREKISSANEALLHTNEITEAAALKNDTLAASIEKLDGDFKRYTTSGGIASFFKFLVEQLRTSLKGLNLLFNELKRFGESRSVGEFTARLFDFVGDKSKAIDATHVIQDKFKSSSTLANQYTKEQNPLGSSTSVVVDALSQQPVGQLKALIDKYAEATRDAQKSFNLYKDSVQAGVLSDGGEVKLAQAKANYERLKGILDQITKAYVISRDKVQKANADVVTTITKNSGNDLTSISGIRKEIARLSKLPGSADPESETAKQIETLKAKLKELAGTAKPAKDAIEKLEDQIKLLNQALNNGLADGTIDASDRALIKKINDAQAAINKINALRQKLQSGDAPAIQKRGNAETAMTDISPQSLGSMNKAQNLIDASGFADQAAEVETRYAKLNAKLLADYRDHTITREQYDEQASVLSLTQSAERYFAEKNRIAALLRNEKEGSKEYIKLKEQEASLDAHHTQDQINDQERLERARIKAIEVVIGYLRNNLGPVSQQLGQGFGNIFQSLTNDLETFAKNGKLSFAELAESAVAITNGITEAFVGASQARIEQLGLERDRDLESAGNNEAAKKAINDRYNKAVAAEKRKQAKLEKEAALISIAINTAVAVVKALPNIPLAIAVGVLGAIELALVAAKPLPKYKGGREGGPGEYAIVNDGSGPEALVKNNRVRFAGRGKETTTWLEPGEKVFTAEKTAKMFSDDKASESFVESLIQGTGVVMNHERIVNEQMLNAIVDSKMSPEMLTACFRTAINEMEIQQLFIDEKGARTYNVKKNQRILDQNARNTTGGQG